LGVETSLRLHDKHLHLQLDLSCQEPPPEESLLLCSARSVPQRHGAIPWRRCMALWTFSRWRCWFSPRPYIRTSSHDFRSLPRRYGCVSSWPAHSPRVPYWCSPVQAGYRYPPLWPYCRSHLHGNLQRSHILVHNRWVRLAIAVPYRSYLHL